ncbi:MAG: PAS domain S-box protein, partial [Bacilli bacterium]|nr:PAS domain S-box protein [Bacilli bacterium]
LEQRLKNTENELANFFNVNLDLFCIANSSGELLKVNQSWNRIMGYELSDLVGKKLFDFIHPEDIEKTNKIFEKSQNEEILSFVNRYKTITGDYIYLEWHSYPYGDNIFASARDVTKRISLENSLNVEKERLNATLFSVGEAVIGIDKDGIVYLFNDEAERILGYHHSEVIGKKINDFVKIYKENNNDECIDFVNKVLNEGKILKNKEEIYLVNKNNKRVPIQLKGNPVKNNMGAVLVISDYSESKQKILEINRLSFYDHLTGVYNRRYYEIW